MKNNYKYVNIILLIILLISNKVFSQEVKIKYIVENKTITSTDIKNEINYLLLINNKLSELNNDLLVEYAAKSLLRERIKEIQLKKNFKFGQNEELVNERVKNFRKSLNINDEISFNDILEKLNLNRNLINRKIEIEVLWNNLIYEKFISQVIIDQNKIKQDLKIKLENLNNEIDEYLIYEILFSADTKDGLNELYNKIKQSIINIGFENTASLLSNSDTSKIGGKIGWVNENQLSSTILKEIKNLPIMEASEPINTPNGILILMVKDKKKIEKEISFDDEFQKMINNEAEKQLTQFSQIYFKKIELNTKIYEK